MHLNVMASILDYQNAVVTLVSFETPKHILNVLQYVYQKSGIFNKKVEIELYP